MTATPVPEQPAGVIHDIGYRHYDGPRLGRGRGVAVLALYSLRAAFGLGRPARSKIIPVLMAGIMTVPAVMSIAVMAIAAERPMEYTEYAVTMQAVLAIFLAAQAPILVSADLRFRVLPLYLSRPVTVGDYIGAKLAALSVALFLLLGVPLTVLYAGELLVDMPGPPATGAYLAAMGGAVIHAVLLASLGLAIASLTPRRGLGVAAVITLYLLTTAVSEVLSNVLRFSVGEDAAGWAQLISPISLADAAQSGLFGVKPTLDNIYPSGEGVIGGLGVPALIAISLGVMFLRYRKAASA